MSSLEHLAAALALIPSSCQGGIINRDVLQWAVTKIGHLRADAAVVAFLQREDIQVQYSYTETPFVYQKNWNFKEGRGNNVIAAAREAMANERKHLADKAEGER